MARATASTSARAIDGWELWNHWSHTREEEYLSAGRWVCSQSRAATTARMPSAPPPAAEDLVQQLAAALS
ncbi:hypothetical protein [Streptomyces lydicus]|uniref:hypothetical protein n=1 Tax=Streptomyces lydicus TaxID=47763 RepID=UPI000F8D132F|nr:hypothetical protein [Streptomyces lydicus]